MIYTDGIHLIAESIDELHAFADSIGLSKRMFRHKARHPHYNLMIKGWEMVYNNALKLGAIKVTTRQLIKISRTCYFIPVTEEEVEAFERKHKWFMKQPITKKEQEALDRIRQNVINKIFPPDQNPI